MPLETPQGSLHKNETELKENSSLREVGEFLKKARLAQNISSKEFADNLRIGEGQLRALENGEEEDLPEPVFIRGMVSRISEKLGLNSQDIIERLKETSENELNE